MKISAQRGERGERTERHDGPRLETLAADFRACVDRRDGSYWERMRVNYETRFCLWNNQSWDGRKWPRRDGKKVFPWPGAADSRVMLVDHYIKVDAAMLMAAWTTQKILVKSTNPATGAKDAGKLTALLRWQIYDDMEEAEDEAELLANMYLERGAAAIGVFWQREEQLHRETVTLEQLMAAAEQVKPFVDENPALALQAALPDLIMQPDREADVAAALRATLMQGEQGEGMTIERLRKIVRDLRTTGLAHFPRPTVVRDRPVMRAFTWNEDVFMPPECVDPQRARAIYVRESLTETDLQERRRSLGYDAEWIDKVIETQRGKVSFDPSERAATRARTWGRGEPDDENLFEVITAFRRLYDDDDVPGIYTTVFSPGLTREEKRRSRREDLVASHSLLDYAHGQYPISPFALERRSRLLDDSRGYGERAHTLQQQIKRQWDARIDRADVATLPPSHYPPGEQPDAWGPGVQIPTLQADRFGYFEIPKYDPGSDNVEQTVRQFADEYFGRRLEGSDSVDAQALRQNLLRGWLRGWKRAFTQVLQLDQQYLPDEVFARVVGSNQGAGIRITRAEIQGQFNMSLQFNVRHLDTEYVKELIAAMQQVLTLDVSGRVDRDELVRAAMELLDPGFAERLLKPGQEATLEQIDDEKNVLAQILLGIPVDVKGNEAFGLRKQTLMQIVQASPSVQKILQANPQAQEMLRTRVEQLDFNIQQKQVNPEIGRRLGTQPMEKAMAKQEAQP
jgi:hypothetical protein